MKPSKISEEVILTELRELAPEDWPEVLDFIDYLKTKRAKAPKRGSVEALLPFFGSWEMQPEEQEQVLREIHDLRHLEEVDR